MEIRILAEGLEFPEGPVALDDGSVVVVEIAAGSVTRMSPDGVKAVVARPGGGPNGAAIGPDGKCYVCNNGGFEWHVDEAGRNDRSCRPRITPAAGSNGSTSRPALSNAFIAARVRCR